MSNTIDKTGGNSNDNQLFSKVAELIELARKKVATTVNLTMVHTYFEIGRMIVEDEQQGKVRAEYGKSVLKDLSIRLTEKFGKGFSVENLDRMRFTFDEKHYFVDLVFYNRLLQCFVLIDLKTDELAHKDLGQMQMYVNYYDRSVKLDTEKPTIGILLCKKKNNALVELTLPKEANIYASEYSLYLPDKQLLQQKLTEWLHEFENLTED